MSPFGENYKAISINIKYNWFLAIKMIEMLINQPVINH
jgi:hypothetical protein